MASLRTGILKQKQRFIAIALLALLLITAAYSLLVGLADIYNHQFDRYERRWQKQGSIASLGEWRVANQWLDRALKLDADHPDYLLSKGRLATWRFFIEDDQTDPDQIRVEASEGIVFIERSLAVRPGWPYAWSALVQLKAQLGQFDSDFFSALEKARQMGAWETDVQLALLDVGLGAWQQLPWGERMASLDLFKVLVSRPGVGKVFRVTDAHNMTAALCISLDEQKVSAGVKNKCRQASR